MTLNTIFRQAGKEVISSAAYVALKRSLTVTPSDVRLCIFSTLFHGPSRKRLGTSMLLRRVTKHVKEQNGFVTDHLAREA